MPRAKLTALLVFALVGCSGSSTDEPTAVDDASAPDATSIDGATSDADASTPDAAVSDTDAQASDAVVDDAASDSDGSLEDTAVRDADLLDALDAADTADAADASDAADAADAGDPASVLPGAACTGTLTDAALVNLYATKPTTGTPSFLIGGSSQARTLGSYTSTLWSRKCASTTGCTAWESAAQPAYESFFSINTSIRAGTVYLWPSGSDHRVGIVSTTVGSDCKGWTEGSGNLVRTGADAKVKLSTEVEDNCVAGADPVFYFEQKDLYDPEGIVTDHCMKLVYRKERNRIDVGPDAWTYDEYMVVYDATF